MKSTWPGLAVLLLSTGLSAVPVAQADIDGPYQLRLGIGFFTSATADNLDPDGSDSVIFDLSEPDDMESTFIPVVLPEGRWDTGAPGGLQLYFNTRPPVEESGGFFFNFGANYLTADNTEYQLGAFIAPFGEVWENPYITGAIREDTDQMRRGLYANANRFAGTNFGIGLVIMEDDVDDDLLGSLLPEMARDGTVYAVRAEYGLQLSRTLELRPGLWLSHGDYDGDSSTYTGYRLELEVSYFSGNVLIQPGIFYSYRDYDADDVIFAASRDRDGYGIDLLLSYSAPFGCENWSVLAITGYGREKSSISFYDTESASLGLFLNYQF